jgi:hypothetical protein
MFIRLSSDELINVGEIRRVIRKDGKTTVYGEWGNAIIEGNASLIDSVDACLTDVLVIVDTKPTAEYVNGTPPTPAQAVANTQAASAPAAVSPARRGPKPKEEPKAFPPTRTDILSTIGGIAQGLSVDRYVAWSAYLETKFGLVSPDGLAAAASSLSDDSLVSFNNLFIAGTKNGVWPWEADKSYAKPVSDPVTSTGIDDDSPADEQEDDVHDPALARVIVEMECMSPENRAAYENAIKKGVGDGKITSTDPLNMTAEDLRRITITLDRWHTVQEGATAPRLQSLSASALARIKAITHPFADDEL